MAPGTFVGELREYLGRWDKASKPAREKMLAEFVRHSRHMTGPELEREFGNGASLLLTRICAFLKTRVHAGDASIGTALQALAVFLGAASGHRFLLEFLDTGGLQMTIQMLTNKKIAEAASCSIPALYAHWLQPVRAGGREAGQNAQLAGVH